MYLAENLKFLREQNGKTQGELAVLFGIEQKTISSWECGSRKPPIGTIVSLAKLYRVYSASCLASGAYMYWEDFKDKRLPAHKVFIFEGGDF